MLTLNFITKQENDTDFALVNRQHEINFVFSTLLEKLFDKLLKFLCVSET